MIDFQATNIERHVLVKNGVPASYVNTLSREIPIPKFKLSQLVGVSVSTINRKIRFGSKLKLWASGRVMFLAQLIGEIDSTVRESPGCCQPDPALWVINWLYEPHDALKGRAPADHFDTGVGREFIATLIPRHPVEE